MTTVAIGSRVDANLKALFDKTALDLGVTPQVAYTVFMKRFVEEGGFPFDVRRPVPSEIEFTRQMDARYQRMLAGHETAHDLIEE